MSWVKKDTWLRSFQARINFVQHQLLGSAIQLQPRSFIRAHHVRDKIKSTGAARVKLPEMACPKQRAAERRRTAWPSHHQEIYIRALNLRLRWVLNEREASAAAIYIYSIYASHVLSWMGFYDTSYPSPFFSVFIFTSGEIEREGGGARWLYFRCLLRRPFTRGLWCCLRGPSKKKTGRKRELALCIAALCVEWPRRFLKSGELAVMALGMPVGLCFSSIGYKHRTPDYIYKKFIEDFIIYTRGQCGLASSYIILRIELKFKKIKQMCIRVAPQSQQSRRYKEKEKK